MRAAGPSRRSPTQGRRTCRGVHLQEGEHVQPSACFWGQSHLFSSRWEGTDSLSIEGRTNSLGILTATGSA
jgi:hypothetical protein